MISEEFFFIHNNQRVSATVDFSPGLTENLDVLNVIGDVTNDYEEIIEISNKELMKEFKAKHWDEIEDERMELVLERSSRLKDF